MATLVESTGTSWWGELICILTISVKACISLCSVSHPTMVVHMAPLLLRVDPRLGRAITSPSFVPWSNHAKLGPIQPSLWGDWQMEKCHGHQSFVSLLLLELQRAEYSVNHIRINGYICDVTPNHNQERKCCRTFASNLKQKELNY